ncbi:MAG: SRPBCC family protein [Candidatus Eremiobacteraeota bacterium]|nr:SRPBCC family protein [Candidatus Eremiobacteraeota bacterium]
MITCNEITIAAPPGKIFAYASLTQNWPQYLPHYRFVRVLRRDEDEQIVEMAAWRGFLPVRWIARQRNDSRRPAIFFHHIAGWTKGMDVEWSFQVVGGKTLVSIEHRLNFRFPFAADYLGKRVVGDFFVHDIASKTLARMKTLAERT